MAHEPTTAFDSLASGGVLLADNVFNIRWPRCVKGTLEPEPFGIAFNEQSSVTVMTLPDYRSVMTPLAETCGSQVLRKNAAGGNVLVPTCLDPAIPDSLARFAAWSLIR